MNWFSVACELQRDWRNDVEGFGALLSSQLPGYQNIIGSYRGAQRDSASRRQSAERERISEIKLELFLRVCKI